MLSRGNLRIPTALNQQGLSLQKKRSQDTGLCDAGVAATHQRQLQKQLKVASPVFFQVFDGAITPPTLLLAVNQQNLYDGSASTMPTV
jgi:hypothetical protein